LAGEDDGRSGWVEDDGVGEDDDIERGPSPSWCSIGGGDTVGRKRMRQRRSDEWKMGNGEIDGVGRGGNCVSGRWIVSVIVGGDLTGRRKYQG